MSVQFGIALSHNGAQPFESDFKETMNPEPGQTNQSSHGGGTARFITGRAAQLSYHCELLLLFCLIEFSWRDAPELQIYHILKLEEMCSMKDVCRTFNPLLAP